MNFLPDRGLSILPLRPQNSFTLGPYLYHPRWHHARMRNESDATPNAGQPGNSQSTTNAVNVRTDAKPESHWLLRYRGPMPEPRHLALPLVWKRRCNGKLYVCVRCHIFAGDVMVWLHESGSNTALHLPLGTLVKRYQPIPMKPVRPVTNPAHN